MKQKRWIAATEWPLAGVSLVFLIVYAWEIIGDVGGGLRVFLDTLLQMIWGLFAVDYVVNLVLAERRWSWFWRHIPDLLIVVLPFLRPLRLLRLLVLVRVLHRAAGNALRGRVAVYVVLTAGLIVFVGALAVLDAERHAPGATITSFPKALWWATVTITTVGYGDFTPVTELGRVLALGLMLAGIALLGVVTATLASWFVERVSEETSKSHEVTREQIANLHEEIEGLRADLRKSKGLPNNSVGEGVD